MPARRPLLVLAVAAAAALIGPPAYATTYCVTADGDGVCVTPDVTVTPEIDTLERLVTVGGTAGVTVTCGGPTLDCPADLDTVTVGAEAGRTGADVDDAGVMWHSHSVHVPDVCLLVTCTGARDLVVATPVGLYVDATVYYLGEQLGS